MKILIVSQYFWPENFRINEIAEFLKSKDIEVDILTGYPNYPEGKIFESYKNSPSNFNTFKGAKIHRIPIIPRGSGSPFNLFVNYTSFLLSSMTFGFIKLRKRKYDYIITFGTSPITVAFTSLFFAYIKKAKTIIWVLDLWPIILKDLDIIKNKFIINLLTRLTNYTYKKHDIILAQSKSFLKEIIKFNKNTSYFPSWPETINKIKVNNDLEDIKLDKYKDYFKVVFTGNIGQAQNFEKIIQLSKTLIEDKVIFIIVGKGRRYKYFKKIKDKDKLKNIIFMGNYPLDKMSYFHNLADALIISLNTGVALNKTIPGKLSTYMSSGKPIIGLIEGEGRKIIEEANAGICLSFENEQYINQIKTFVNLEKKELERLGNNGAKYSDIFFNKEKILSDLFKILNQKQETQKDEIKILLRTSEIPFEKNFVLSGLNLAFLGYWSAKKIKLYKNLIHWPDGLFKNIFFSTKIKKVPGRTLVKEMIIPKFIKKITIAGKCSETSKKYLDLLFKDIAKTYIDLPYSTPEIIEKYIPTINKNELLFLTLPTPKQEQVAELLTERSEYYKIICIGAGIEMASGNERSVPESLENYGLEAIFRLRSDTSRRIKRLIVTTFFLIDAILRKKIKKINARIYEKNKL